MRSTVLYLVMAVLIFTLPVNGWGQDVSAQLAEQAKKAAILASLAGKLMNQSISYGRLAKDLNEIVSNYTKKYELNREMGLANFIFSREHGKEMVSDLLGVDDRFMATGNLCLMYVLLIDPYKITDPDKDKQAKTLIKGFLDHSSRQIDFTIKYINSVVLIREQDQVIIEYAMRIKDELYKGQEILRSANIE